MLQDWLARARATWRPAMYHGHGRRHGLFEGWYFKVVDAPERRVLAVIPGVFLGRDSSLSHCFVQVLDGIKAGERVVTKGAYAIRLSSISGAIPAHGHAH